MKVVIVEDELAASENLTYLLHSIDNTIEVLKVIDSVKSSVAYFSKPHEAELVFMDIHLADGISFEIFDSVTINIPVIFTTAYNQYALKAFKFNSIDYLLKPIDKDELADALEQFKVQTKQKGIADHQIKGRDQEVSRPATGVHDLQLYRLPGPAVKRPRRRSPRPAFPIRAADETEIFTLDVR